MIAFKKRGGLSSQDNSRAKLDDNLLQQYTQVICRGRDLKKEHLQDCQGMLRRLYHFGFLQPNKPDDDLKGSNNKNFSSQRKWRQDMIDSATEQFIQSIHSNHRDFGIPQFGTCDANLVVIKDLLESVGPISFKVMTVVVTAFYKHRLFCCGHYAEDYLHSGRPQYFVPRDRSLKPLANIVSTFLQSLQLKKSPLIKNIDAMAITLLTMQYYCCAREAFSDCSFNENEIDAFIALAEAGCGELCLTVFSGLLPFACKPALQRGRIDKTVKRGDYRALLCQPPLNNIEKIALLSMEFLIPAYAHNSRVLLAAIAEHRNPRSYLRAVINIFTLQYKKNLAQRDFEKDYCVENICRYVGPLKHLSFQEQKIYCIQKDTFSSILKMGDNCKNSTDFMLYHHLRNKHAALPRSAIILDLLKKRRLAGAPPEVKSFCSAELEACAIRLTIDNESELPIKLRGKALHKYIKSHHGLATAVLIAHRAGELDELMWRMLMESPLQALYTAYMLCKQKQIVSVWEQCRADIDAIDRLVRSAQILGEFFGNDSAMIILHYVSMASYFCNDGFFGRHVYVWKGLRQVSMAEPLFFAIMRDRKAVSKILAAYKQEHEKQYHLGCITIQKHWKKSSWDLDHPENHTFYQLYKHAKASAFFSPTTADVFKENFGIDCSKENNLTTVIANILKSS